MKFTLKPKDIERLDELKQSPFNSFLRDTREQNFSVGDILIRRQIDITNNSKEVQVQQYGDSNVPVRYLVVDKDEANTYLTLINENGKIDNGIFLAWDEDSYDWGSYDIYEVDPLFVDAIMLGTEFDIGHILKEEVDRKRTIAQKNKDMSKQFNNLKDLNKYLLSLGKGKTIFFHEKRCSAEYCAGFTLHPRKYNLKYYKSTTRGRYKVAQHQSRELNCNTVLYLCRTPRGATPITSIDLLNCIIYEQKPLSMKPQI